MAMHAILKHRPDAIFIQSESTQYFHPETPACQDHARRFNEKRFLSLDLTYGHHVNATIYEYLLDNGMTRDEYHWFLQHHVRSRCVMGNDYYVTNENLVHRDGSLSLSGEVFGYYPITHQYFARYHLPVMHTETNGLGGRDAVRWLNKEWANVHRLDKMECRCSGSRGTAFRIRSIGIRPCEKTMAAVNTLGLCDMDRNINPVGHAYKKLISAWREMLPHREQRAGNLSIAL